MEILRIRILLQGFDEIVESPSRIYVALRWKIATYRTLVFFLVLKSVRIYGLISGVPIG
jgi:hypothetical protein